MKNEENSGCIQVVPFCTDKNLTHQGLVNNVCITLPSGKGATKLNH